MNTPRNKLLSKRLGSALVMTLVIIVLITVVTVGYLASVMLETRTAGAGLDQEKAYGVAMIGVHEAMARVRDALTDSNTGVSWDNPYENFATNPPPFFWSLSPGRITRWYYTNTNATPFALFSGETNGKGLVNLNRKLADGSFPIIGGTPTPAVSVKWVNLLRDPASAASSDNAIIGRYAFWVDDESAKININTADGTEKTNATKSLGAGSPTEVSLEVLFPGTGGRGISKEIVQIARTKGFHSPREILSVTDVTSDNFANNVFSLTTESRSPELNVFGQPRMALLPAMGDGSYRYATDMTLSGITFQPIREIYPTPSQLPRYTWNNPRINESKANSWPLAFRQEYALGTHRGQDFDQYWLYTVDNYFYGNGMMLAKYLSGKNAAGRDISWPVFPNSPNPSTNGFAGKYTPRQIDSIAAQICDLGARAISPDNLFASNETSANASWLMETKRERSSVPSLFPGFVSGQWVSGLGRCPKVSRLHLQFKTTGSSGVFGDEGNPYIPPKVRLGIWVEWWLPSGFLGGKNALTDTYKEFTVATPGSRSLNLADGVADLGDPNLPHVPAMLPKANVDESAYWSNQLLYNNQGVDWRGNVVGVEDPEPMADPYHHPYAFKNNRYEGTVEIPNQDSAPFSEAEALKEAGTKGRRVASVFEMAELGRANEWTPGEIRCIRNYYASLRYPMATNATNLEVRGGIAVLGQMRAGTLSHPDPVPLEAIRGIRTQEPKSMSIWTWEPYSATSSQGSSETVRDRVIKSVIPVNSGSTPPIWVPPLNDPGEGYRNVLAKVQDPLVNKFPGDWNVSDGIPLEMAATGFFKSYSEDAAWRSSLGMTDPHSYWMPQIDSLYYLGESAEIPRSARFPSVGFLQYVRTGIIPDDESPDLRVQHGTPFRLLSFAPSTEGGGGDPLTGQETTLGSKGSYPDWALLDLLYVPSTLSPHGGPYGAGPNLAYYGTYGGATAGRINPNGSVIYTTNVNSPQPDVSRTLPLQAVINGSTLKLRQDSTETVVDAAQAKDIATAIKEYVRANGPMRIPGEVSNVKEVADLRPSFNKTRNDLVRQMVGNLTTQGNVFSVWTAGQTILKNRKSAKFDEFEPGDTVQAEVRLHFVIERYLDPGADGIYGTYNDPEDPVNHPFQPRYLYRVIASEEIR